MSEVEIIEYSQIQGLSIFLNSVEYRTPHLHPEWELIWLLEGVLSLKVEDGSYSMEKGSLLLLPPGMVHEFNAGTERASFLCLQMTSDFLTLSKSVTTKSIFPAEFLTAEEMTRVKRMLLDASLSYFKRPPLFEMFSKGECILLMHALLSHMPIKTMTAEELSSRKRKNERLERLMAYVEEHYREKISLSDFAEKEGVSMNYLSHFVKEVLGQSFQSYVNLVRFHAAVRLIRAQKYRMTEIYSLAGFSDYKYFSAAFKARSGLTPEEFSRNASSEKADVQPESRMSQRSSERRLGRDESIDFIIRTEIELPKY